MFYLLPKLRSICIPRHPGLTPAVAAAYAEAAEVCLARHHRPPLTRFSVRRQHTRRVGFVAWRKPSLAAQRAFNNHDDATRDAAYILALAAVEAELGLMAVARAETRTGADYYVGPPGSTDLESAYRLEVSGVDAQSTAAVYRRLEAKIDQARAGQSNLPALASVVAFLHQLILIAAVTGETHDDD